MRAITSLLAIIVICLFSALGCSPELWRAIGQSMQETGKAYQTKKLMIFGGRGHKTYLGCLSCNAYSSESVFNKYGTYGSSYSTTSILNHYSTFGSKYSTYSACNPYASDPPIVVDDNGTYYGRLTVNIYLSDLYSNQNTQTWLRTVVCGN